MLKRTFAIIKKEIQQLKRDKRFLFVLFFFPVLLLVIFGYAVNFDVKHVKLAIYDQEKTVLSRDFINSITNSEYFDYIIYINSEKEINDIIDKKLAQCVMVIPNDLSKKFYSNRNVKVQFLIDGVDGNTATIISNYVNSATASFSNKILMDQIALKGGKQFVPIIAQPQFWFNPDLKSSKFLVPGLIAMILIVTAVISVSLTMVREKERGTIEQLNVSSLNTIELIIGKTFPFLVIALLNASFILIASYFLFDVTVKGSIILLLITTIVFLFASTSLGIFISTISDSQQVAFSFATFASLLPSVILSGFIFPIDNMPVAVQVITNITPAKFFIVILRGIMLRGVGLEAFWQQVIYLILFASFFVVLTLIVNKRKLKTL